MSQTACMQGLDVGTTSQASYVSTLAEQQRVCLFNLQPVPGYADLFDTSMHMPFNWQWINYVSWSKPPTAWTIPQRAADTGLRVELKTAQAENGMFGNVKNGAYVNVSSSGPKLKFIQVQTPDGSGSYFRSADDPTLFLGFQIVLSPPPTGQVMLWNDTTTQMSYTLPAAAGNHTAIRSQYLGQYMWVDGKGNVYVTSKGDPAHTSAQWTVRPDVF